MYDHTVANIYRKGLRAGKHSVNDIKATYLADEHLKSRSLWKACCLASIQSSLQYFAFPLQHRASALLEASLLHRPLPTGQKKVHNKAKIFDPHQRWTCRRGSWKTAAAIFLATPVSRLRWEGRPKAGGKRGRRLRNRGDKACAVAEGNLLLRPSWCTRPSHEP